MAFNLARVCVLDYGVSRLTRKAYIHWLEVIVEFWRHSEGLQSEGSRDSSPGLLVQARMSNRPRLLS